MGRETPCDLVWVNPFALSERALTNREWIAFMAAGGCVHAPPSPIERHLEPVSEKRATICADRFGLGQGGTIHTENSHKYDAQRLSDLAHPACWYLRDYPVDAIGLFSDNLQLPH